MNRQFLNKLSARRVPLMIVALLGVLVFGLAFASFLKPAPESITAEKPAAARPALAPTAALVPVAPAASAPALPSKKSPKVAQGPASAPSAAMDGQAMAFAQPISNSTAALMSGSRAFCDEVVRRLPNVSKSMCLSSEVVATPARSNKGHPLYQRDVISDNAHLRVLVVGGIHGDELSSTALVLHWIGAAMETPSNIHWRFVPLMNPDGMLKPRPTRTNANGVDLNRNFPTPNWDKEATFYWKKRTKNDPRRYPGPHPLSEPESKWLHDEMERWKPNLIVSVHAPYGVLDFDGPVSPPQRLGRLYLDQVGIFPGSLGNYGGVHKKVPVVTIELPSAMRTPQEAEIRQMWLDLLRWTAERLGAG